jgi:hypothetical protein
VWVVLSGGKAAERRRRFQRLSDNKAEIESRYGGPIGWIASPKDPFVGVGVSEVGLLERDQWPATTAAMVDGRARLSAAVAPFL